MIKRILVPLDGSEFTKSATEYAIKLAKRTGATVTGLTIIDEPEIMLPEPVPAGAGEFVEHKHKVLMEKAAKHNEEYMKQFSAKCSSGGVKNETMERTGHPEDEIAHESHRHDLIILGRLSFFKAMTQEGPCKTTDHVVKKSSRPMILMPEKFKDGHDIIITNDDSIGSSRTFQMAQLCGLLKDAGPVIIASVNSDKAVAEKNCMSAADFLHAHSIKTESRPVQSDKKPWDEILDMINKNHPELVTMGAFGHTGLKELFFGSFTKTMLEKCPAPLFISH